MKKALFSLFLSSLFLFLSPQSLAQSFSDPTLGESDAPIHMEIFDDYQCPFCSQFHETLKAEEIQEMINEGTLRITFKDFPLAFHAQARTAARAVNAVQNIRPSKVHQYIDILFVKQSEWSAKNTELFLQEYAVSLDIPEREFTNAFTTKANETEIEEDFQEGLQRGINGTPSFFINETKYSGALPLEDILEGINTALRTFEKEEELSTRITAIFPDVRSNTLLAQASNYLAAKNVIKGTPEGLFEGQRLVNRAEAMTMILRALKANTTTSSLQSFTDVPRNAWFAPFVEKAKELKIIEGYPDGSFKPERSVQRDEFLVMLSKAFGISKSDVHNFADQDESPEAWYWDYAGIAWEYSLFPEGNRLNASQSMTRAEVAIALYQYLSQKDS